MPAPGGRALNWDDVQALADAEGLAPALGYLVKAGTLDEDVPGAVRAALGRAFGDALASQLRLGHVLGRLLRALDREGVPVIPLKGLALAETFYPDPVLRPSRDVDLLVRPDTVLTVDALLQSLGYRRLADAHSWRFDLAYDRATLYEGPGGVHVDLHWSLLSDPRYAWNEAGGLEVWDRAIRIRVAGEEALSPCPEDLLLYLAVHLAVHHGLTGLRWYWDIALLLGQRTFDWDVVGARASRWRVRTALYFVLLGCQRFFDVSTPGPVMARLKPWGPRASTLGRLVLHHGADRLQRLEHLIALLLVDRARDLLAPLASIACPSPAWLRARYEGVSASLPGHYLAHYRRLAAVAGAAVSGTRETRIPPP
ncbi:MAG: nucleotidyltransferase domain-containing protein [Candidatus Rokuibacteriota bacterium]